MLTIGIIMTSILGVSLAASVLVILIIKGGKR